MNQILIEQSFELRANIEKSCRVPALSCVEWHLNAVWPNIFSLLHHNNLAAGEHLTV